MITDLRRYEAGLIPRLADTLAREHQYQLLDPEQLRQRLEELVFRDEAGVYCTVGPWSRRWFRFEAGKWQPAAAPSGLLEGSASALVHLPRPAPPELPDVDPAEPAPPAERGPDILALIVRDARARYEAGRITSDGAEALLQRYFLVEASGRCWTVGCRTGNWYLFADGQWRLSPGPPDPQRLLRTEPAPEQCPQCHAPLSPNAEQCERCGTPVVPRLRGWTPEIGVAMEDFLTHGVGVLPEPVALDWTPPGTFPETPRYGTICPRCGAANAGNQSSCLICHAPLREIVTLPAADPATPPLLSPTPRCPKCGAPLPPDARFCSQCGKAVT